MSEQSVHVALSAANNSKILPNLLLLAEMHSKQTFFTDFAEKKLEPKEAKNAVLRERNFDHKGDCKSVLVTWDSSTSGRVLLSHRW